MATISPQFSAAIEAIRAEYQREIESLAEHLRPRFEAGELHAWRESDHGEGEDRLHKLVTAHFGLEVTESVSGRYRVTSANDAVIHAILSASPTTDATSDNWTHPAYHALSAAAWDVINIARARGWYCLPPGDDETPHAEHFPENCPGCSEAA